MSLKDSTVTSQNDPINLSTRTQKLSPIEYLKKNFGDVEDLQNYINILDKNCIRESFIETKKQDGLTKLGIPIGMALELEQYYVPYSATHSQNYPTSQYSRKKKKFDANGYIYPFDPFKYYIDPQEESDRAGLTDAVLRGNWIMLHGSRSSGKTTRIVRLMDVLYRLKDELIPFRVTLQNSKIETADQFWSSLYILLMTGYPKVFHNKDFKNSDEFTHRFTLVSNNQFFEGRRAVLIIDEFDQLYCQLPQVELDQVLSILRSIRDNYSIYTIQSIIVVGPFGILEGNNISRSPFNVIHSIANPDFSLSMTTQMFQEFSETEGLEIEESIIQDIYSRTGGHAGLINVCGNIIEKNMVLSSGNRFTYEQWMDSLPQLYEQMSLYGTTQRMIQVATFESSHDLMKQSIPPLSLKDIQKTIFYLLRSNDSVNLETDLWPAAKYLVSEGLAISPSVEKWTIRSPLIQCYLLRHLNNIHRHNHPELLFPLKGTNQIDIPKLITESINFFNKNDMTSSVIISSKVYKNFSVPCEATYHEELYSIINSWRDSAKVQLFTNVKVYNPLTNSKCCDIQLRVDNGWIYNLEIVAHEPLGNAQDKGSIIEHVHRTSTFYSQLSNEAWVINFTIDSETTDFLSPYPNVKIIHVLHNLTFSQLQIKVQQSNNTFHIKNFDL